VATTTTTVHKTEAATGTAKKVLGEPPETIA
jgi:hypothetical protein